MAANGSANRRVVRVFISSTFRDMQAERDELAKVVFPELKRFCRERDVEFVEVDLRWGVTEEQSQRGETLRLCLEEISRCRPYFIGLLGERYGWVPWELQAEDREDYPWIDQAPGRSLTELEILHGVLNDRDMAERARFYFRDPAYLKTLSAESQSDYTSENPDAIQKLVDLKARIRASGLPVVENYPDPQTAARRIGEDLRRMIEEEYPLEEQIDPLDREAAEQEAYARSREEVYIGREAYYAALDSFALGESSNNTPSSPLVVLGASGGGKTALLANWVRRYRQQHPEDFVLVHFIGSTPSSADYAAILRQVMAELKRRFGLKGKMPEKREELLHAFPNWLAMAEARMGSNQTEADSKPTLLDGLRAMFRKLVQPKPTQGARIVLILDGLNQLEERDNAPDLGWLPEIYPNRVRLIVSTLPGHSLEALQRRPHSELQVEPITLPEREHLVETYLARFSRRLDRSRLERIASAEACANPLYLRVLLEELRLVGLHEKLAERLEEYLEAGTVEALYQKVLGRFAVDYDPVRRGVWNPSADYSGNLVDDALGLIWAARRGLSENELLDLLGKPPRAAWTPLFLALEDALVEQRGVLNFFHEYLRKAVEMRCLPGEARQKEMRLRLASYFAGRLEANKTPRVLDELPWLWMMAGEWRRLYDLLARIEIIDILWQENTDDLRTYWAAIEANSNLCKVDAYQPVLDDPGKFVQNEITDQIAFLFRDTGYPEEALKLEAYLANYYKELGDRDGYQAAIGYQALILIHRGDLDRSMALSKEGERIFRQQGNLVGLASSLGAQGGFLVVRGDLDGAMALYKEQEHISQQLGDLVGLASSLGNQANILYVHGDLVGGMALYKEQERIFRQQGNLVGLATNLDDQGWILYERGDLDRAMALFREAEPIFRQLGHLDGLASSLGKQAKILHDRGDRDGAMALYKEGERIFRQQGNLVGLATNLCYQGWILYERGDLDRAMALFREAEPIFRQLGHLDGLASSLGKQAKILHDRGDRDAAMALYKEGERIFRRQGNLDGLASSLNNQGMIMNDRGDLEGAMALYKEEGNIYRQLGKEEELAICLGDQAKILYERGDLDGGMALYKEQEHIFRQLGNLDGLASSLNNQGVIMKGRGDLNGAMALNKEGEHIFRQLGKLDGLARSLGNQARILNDRGDLVGAMASNKEGERIFRQLGNLDGLAICLGDQANILYDRGDLEGAMALNKERERIFRQLGKQEDLAVCLGDQANILYERGDLEWAMALYKDLGHIYHEMGNLYELQLNMRNQANILYSQGDLDGALVLFKEQERICREADHPDWLVICLANQALTLKARGDLDGAMALLKEQERICRQTNDQEWLATGLRDQASILNIRGDLDGALVLYKEQGDICQELGKPDWLASSLANQAIILSRKGDQSRACELAVEALQLAKQSGNIKLSEQLRIDLQDLAP